MTRRRIDTTLAEGLNTLHLPGVMGATRQFANERERGRNQSVNGAFQVLRDLIPTEPMDRKLSKIETLRLATKYIEHLSTLISSGYAETPCLKQLACYSHQQDDPSGNHRTPRRSLCTFCLAKVKKPAMKRQQKYTDHSASLYSQPMPLICPTSQTPSIKNDAIFGTQFNGCSESFISSSWENQSMAI